MVKLLDYFEGLSWVQLSLPIDANPVRFRLLIQVFHIIIYISLIFSGMMVCVSKTRCTERQWFVIGQFMSFEYICANYVRNLGMACDGLRIESTGYPVLDLQLHNLPNKNLSMLGYCFYICPPPQDVCVHGYSIWKAGWTSYNGPPVYPICTQNSG